MSAPPAYHEHTFTLAHDALVDDLHASHSTPQYSADAPPSERVLQTAATSSSPVPSVFQSSSSADFIFKGYALEINLGPKLWNLSLPAYGHNGYVEGTVKLYKNCTYTHRLVVSLTGQVSVTCRGRGVIADAFSTVVSHTVTIPLPNDKLYYPTEETFAFSLPFPTYVQGGNLPIPPSFAAWSPGVSTEISYTLRVDAYRKGLRRHEDRTVPIFYLPKSWPTVPPFRGNIMTDFAHPNTRIKRIRLARIVSQPSKSKSKAQQTQEITKRPQITLSIPALPTFSSGFPIPLKIDISCPEAPALPKILWPLVDVRLLRRLIATVDGKLVPGSRDIVLTHGTLIETATPQEGMTVSHYEIMAGQSGQEQTWRVEGILEVRYIIAVSVTPSDQQNYLPRYRHEEVIHVVSEPWGTREREMLQLEGLSAPALALNGARRHLRLTHSMDW